MYSADLGKIGRRRSDFNRPLHYRKQLPITGSGSPTSAGVDIGKGGAPARRLRQE